MRCVHVRFRCEVRVNLPHDLKHYAEKREGLTLFTPDEALAILVCLLFICWLADRLNLFV